MSMNLVNLNVNPCKMCMPMGSVTALFGIRHSMSILHGSQGCATYIRRHMATHYNEPIDVASSALTEQGTVFGGADNLLKGIKNVIKVYNPEIIGISTTCLAETIGEDVKGIIYRFYQENPDEKVKIIHVSSGGYAGTQYEGFFRALHSILSQTAMQEANNKKVNIITGQISPADTRWLKTILDQSGLEYILLPDLADNLDGGYNPEYSRLPEEGTTLEEISQMGGARFTLELTNFVEDAYSPAKYLSDTYGVPYKRLSLPVGLKATDALLDELTKLGGTIIPAVEAERRRYLDALVDAHKYSALGRAVIFGEPDTVKAITDLCCESGIVPVAVTTGSECSSFKAVLQEKVKKACDRLLVEKSFIVDDADFDKIEELAVETKANVMIGNGDGRRVAAKLGIDLIRCGFPIHDQVGGQRVRMLGYEGSLDMLDKVNNALLLQVSRNFKSDNYAKYYSGSEYGGDGSKFAMQEVKMLNNRSLTKEETRAINSDKTKTHPCYNCGAGQFGRIHLPIAPKCNIQCNYCLRKYDCPNESRPGVTTEVLGPQEALAKYLYVKERVPNLTVVGIAGPGDALANFVETRETLKLIREQDPDVTFCLSTNGLMLPTYAQELVDLGVSHVTVTINAVDPVIGARIYHHINFLGQTYTGEAAAGILLGNQLSGLKFLTDRGVICKVNIVMLKGINDDHIEEVVKTVRNLNCEITNIMQMIPVQGSIFENMPLVSNKEVMEMRTKCGEHLKQMLHCKQCRADAIGTLGNDISLEFRSCHKVEAQKEERELQRVAVATSSGILVDQHFGHAKEFYIYESDGVKVKFIEKRQAIAYCTGQSECDDGKDDKIENIISTIKDCGVVLALRIGSSPSQRLSAIGIRSITTYDRIEDAVKKAAGK